MIKPALVKPKRNYWIVSTIALIFILTTFTIYVYNDLKSLPDLDIPTPSPTTILPKKNIPPHSSFGEISEGVVGYTSSTLQYGNAVYNIWIQPYNVKPISVNDFPCEERKTLSGYKMVRVMYIGEGSTSVQIQRAENGRMLSVEVPAGSEPIEYLELGQQQIFYDTEQDGTWASLLPVSLNPIVDIIGLVERKSCFDTKFTAYGFDPKQNRLITYDFVQKDGSSKNFIYIPKGVKIPQRDDENNIIEDKYIQSTGKWEKTRYKFDIENNRFVEIESWIQ